MGWLRTLFEWLSKGFGKDRSEVSAMSLLAQAIDILPSKAIGKSCIIESLRKNLAGCFSAFHLNNNEDAITQQLPTTQSNETRSASAESTDTPKPQDRSQCGGEGGEMLTGEERDLFCWEEAEKP